MGYLYLYLLVCDDPDSKSNMIRSDVYLLVQYINVAHRRHTTHRTNGCSHYAYCERPLS